MNRIAVELKAQVGGRNPLLGNSFAGVAAAVLSRRF